jgi:ubiquinone/menaquinone biosynthesis C-methylase UbiE
MTSSEEHDRLVREQFRIQASAFDQQVGSRGYDQVLPWIMGLLELDDSLSVLDVAAGTGLVAREIAPRVKTVVALDSTPEMLEQGRQQAATAGLANLEFEPGDAQRLPYPDGTFDLVTCRLGMHHFFDPQVQAKEMARVCRPGGQVAIIDITSTEDQAEATLHNRLERLRDPSHTRALTVGELTQVAEQAGLKIRRSGRLDAGRNLSDWLDLTDTPEEARREVTRALEAELEGGPVTGMMPYSEEGQLFFQHKWVMLVGGKVA